MVLVYTESEGGTYKKIAFEAVSYAKGIADAMGSLFIGGHLGAMVPYASSS